MCLEEVSGIGGMSGETGSSKGQASLCQAAQAVTQKNHRSTKTGEYNDGATASPSFQHLPPTPPCPL